MERDEVIIKQYTEHLNEKDFPCVAAKASLARGQVKCFVASHMGCPADDVRIADFLYGFIDAYRDSKQSFHSAAVIFKAPQETSDFSFDALLWQRLSALRDLDKIRYKHDGRVDADPDSASYSFSLKEEAFFIIGLHQGSSRKARQFSYPTLVFNPHAEFEKLRALNRYDKLKDIVRNRDVAYSGSVNPLLQDFGKASEIHQYSGMAHSKEWRCPLSN